MANGKKTKPTDQREIEQMRQRLGRSRAHNESVRDWLEIQYQERTQLGYSGQVMVEMIWKDGVISKVRMRSENIQE